MDHSSQGNNDSQSRHKGNDRSSDTSDSKEKGMSGMFDLSGVLGGFSQIINQLGNLAEKGEQLKRASQSSQGVDSKDIASSFGYTVKFGGEAFSKGSTPSNDSFTAQPMAKSAKPASPSNPSWDATSVREPMVDSFDESNQYVIVAEMPGVAAEGVELQFGDAGQLKIIGKSRFARYEKSLQLPDYVTSREPQMTSNNGILEIRFNSEKT